MTCEDFWTRAFKDRSNDFLEEDAVCADAALAEFDERFPVEIKTHLEDASFEWKDWDGALPLPAGTRVEVVFRNGETDNKQNVGDWQWEHYQDDYDIVKYRAIKD